MDIDKDILKPVYGMDFILNLYEIPKQKLASDFKVEPSATSNWRKRGIPKKYAKRLEEQFGIDIKYFNKELTPHEQLMLKNQKQSKELIKEAVKVTESIKDGNGNVFKIEVTHIDLTNAKETEYEISRRNMIYNMLMLLQRYEKIDNDGRIDFEQASDRVQVIESFIRLLTHEQMNVEIVQMIIDAIRGAEELPRSDYGIESQNEEFVRVLSTHIKQFKDRRQQGEQK